VQREAVASGKFKGWDNRYDLAYLPAVECSLPPEENKNESWVAVVKK